MTPSPSSSFLQGTATVAVPTVTGATDQEEVRRFAELIFDPLHTVEIRRLKRAQSIVCRGDDYEGICRAAVALSGDVGVYFTLHPLSLPEGSRRAARKADVVRRRWLLVDGDPVRPAETNSTDAEKALTLDCLHGVSAYLLVRGWHEPITIDSGNGYHLYYRIDLPSDEATRVLMRDTLLAISEKFSTAQVEIDPLLFDAPRLSKVAGTMTRKGTHTADRPQRMARIVRVPEWGDAVSPITAEQMAEVIADLKATPAAARATVPASHAGRGGTTPPALVGKATEAVGDDDQRKRETAYAVAAMNAELWAVTSAPVGGRNNQLNVSAMKLGQLVAAGLLAEEDVVSSLQAVAQGAGLAEAEIAKTIKSGLAYGKSNPRRMPEMLDAEPRGVPSSSSTTTQATAPKILSMADLMRLEIAPPTWAVPGLMSEGLTILGGKAKLGKSWMALNLAITLAAGGLALGGIRVVAGDVLYLSLEDRLRRVQDRARKVLEGMHEKASERLSIAVDWPRINEGGLDHIERWCQGCQCPRLVIVDVWAKFRPPTNRGGLNAYESDYAHFDPVKRLSDRLGVSFLIVHHLRKSPGEDKLDALTGSLGIGGSVDGVLILTRQRNQKDAELFVTGRDTEETTLAVRFDEQACTWHRLGAAEAITHSRIWSIALTMLRRPGVDGITTKDLAEEAKVTVDVARNALHRMEDRGAVTVSRSGVKALYRLSDVNCSADDEWPEDGK